MACAGWQSVAVLVGLDNLYGDHNPSGMVIADYTDEYLPLFEPPSPVIKSDLGTPPPGPGTPGPGLSVAGWSREEQAILAAFPELAGAPELARRVQVAYLAARRRYVAAMEDRYAGYRAFREELESDPERMVDVPRDGDCFLNSLLVLAGHYLRTRGRSFGWADREPTVKEMRDAVAWALEESYLAYWAAPGTESAQEAGLFASLFPDLIDPDSPNEDRDARLAEYARWIRRRGNWNWQLPGGGNVGDNMALSASLTARLMTCSTGVSLADLDGFYSGRRIWSGTSARRARPRKPRPTRQSRRARSPA